MCLEYIKTKDHFGVLCFVFLCLEHVETKDRFGASGPREQQCMMTSAFLQPQFLRHRIQSVQTQYIRCDGHVSNTTTKAYI